jgi:hypothetical protein
MKLICTLCLTLALAAIVCAQRPRSMDTASAPADVTKAKPAPAPQSVKAKYEGGVFGYNHTMDGTLSFDDTNKRLLFKNEKQKEILFVPYNAVNSAFSDTQKRRPTAATVAQHIPYVGFPLGFIKTKVRYLTLQYSDPDTNVSGVTSFKLDNKDMVDSMVYALANRAGLAPRGEIYVKKTDSAEVKTNP